MRPAPYVSDPADLVLHGPRVLGFASADRVAVRYRLPTEDVVEHLLDHEAHGWVTHTSFAGSSGWSVTAAGRAEDERRMTAELDRSGVRPVVAAAHQDFLPLNGRVLRACTAWQVRPTRADPLAANDHSDWPWDERVLRTLATVGTQLRELGGPLAGALARFDGYTDRYAAALAKVDRGDRRMVDAPDRDSCHTVWIQLHEDLLATLGIPRGSET